MFQYQEVRFFWFLGMVLSLLPIHTLSAEEPAKIETIAGSQKGGFSGDGGPAKDALLNKPFHCDLDNKGNLFIVDTMNGRIRKMDLKSSIITTVAGNGEKGSTGDGGLATKASVDSPYAIAIDTNTEDIYLVEQRTTFIRKIDGKTGIISRIAGTNQKGYSGDNGPGTSAMLREPNDCCLDGKGGLLIADVADWRIRRLDLKTGIISTFAGTGRPSDSSILRQVKKGDRSKIGDGGKATQAVVVGARAIAVDSQGNAFICEREGNAIRKIDAKGMKISTVAGGRLGTGGDGSDATLAALDKPHGCIIAPDGTLYIADTWNNRIRRVSRAK